MDIGGTSILMDETYSYDVVLSYATYAKAESSAIELSFGNSAANAEITFGQAKVVVNENAKCDVCDTSEVVFEDTFAINARSLHSSMWSYFAGQWNPNLPIQYAIAEVWPRTVDTFYPHRIVVSIPGGNAGWLIVFNFDKSTNDFHAVYVSVGTTTLFSFERWIAGERAEIIAQKSAQLFPFMSGACTAILDVTQGHITATLSGGFYGSYLVHDLYIPTVSPLFGLSAFYPAGRDITNFMSIQVTAIT